MIELIKLCVYIRVYEIKRGEILRNNYSSHIYEDLRYIFEKGRVEDLYFHDRSILKYIKYIRNYIQTNHNNLSKLPKSLKIPYEFLIDKGNEKK